MIKLNLFYLALIIISITIGCSKDDDSNGSPNNYNSSNNNNNNNQNSATEYFNATIDGKSYKISLNDQGYVDYISSYKSYVNNDTTKAVYGSRLESSNGHKSPGIYFGEFQWSPKKGNKKAKFHEFFQKKQYGYQNRALRYGEDSSTYYVDVNQGVRIEWVDENGKFWSSRNENTSPDAQKSSSFKITKIMNKGKQQYTGYPIVECKMKFNCKLYDTAGSSIMLKNGVAKMTFNAE